MTYYINMFLLLAIGGLTSLSMTDSLTFFIVVVVCWIPLLFLE